MSHLRIRGVALRLDDGTVLALPEPYRHHHALWIYATLYEFAFISDCPRTRSAEQGFVDDYGFLDRTDALRQALCTGQVEAGNLTSRSGHLFSEDLW